MKDGLWWSVLSSLATGSPGLQLTMNHGSEAWHTPQVKGTSSLKSFRKRPLPSLPAKAEWRTKVFQWGEETAGLQDWPPPVVPEGILPVGEDAATLPRAIPRVN